MAKSKQSRSKKSLSKTFKLLISLLFFFFSLLLASTLFTLGFILVPTNPHDISHSASRENDEAEDDQESWTEIISWEPRAILYHNFLTKAECDHLINISKPHLRRSYVVDSKTGAGVVSSARTSYGYFLKNGQDAIVDGIEKKISEFTFIPKENGEAIQILRYENGQEYKPHHDYFIDKFSSRRGGQRIATVLMYLSDVEEGGETVFPFAKGNFSKRDDVSACARNGLAVKPRMGDALLFWSMKPDGTPDKKSIHVGCPVIKGTKWSATKWLRMNEFI